MTITTRKKEEINEDHKKKGRNKLRSQQEKGRKKVRSQQGKRKK
jgi:hypothetical protein